MIIQEGIAPKLLEKLKAAAEKIVVGDGTHANTQMGPIVCEQQYRRVMEYVKKGKEEGATLLTGGKRCVLKSGKPQIKE